MDAIKRKKEVQKMHDILKESVQSIQNGIDEFSPAMYVDDRIAGLGVGLVKTHLITIMDAMFSMEIPPAKLADTFVRLVRDEKEREIILMLVALIASSTGDVYFLSKKNGDSNDKQ